MYHTAPLLPNHECSSQVKEDNRKTTELDNRSKEIDSEMKKGKRQLVELQNDLQERERGDKSKVRGDEERSGELVNAVTADLFLIYYYSEIIRPSQNDTHKYEKLFQRDNEMTTFLGNFDKQKEETVQDQERTRQTIVALLEHISSGIGSTEDMPSQERLEEMKDEVR